MLDFTHDADHCLLKMEQSVKTKRKQAGKNLPEQYDDGLLHRHREPRWLWKRRRD
jgi:hypothetical protein